MTEAQLTKAKRTISQNYTIDTLQEYNSDFTNKFKDDIWKFKGYFIFANDTSIISLPNNKKTKKKFNIDPKL